MSICLRRRECIAGLGGVAAWPLVARAQRPAMRVIGYLSDGTPAVNYMDAFRKDLSEMGYVEPNVRVEFRWAAPAGLPGLAADLVRSQVALIVAPGGNAL